MATSAETSSFAETSSTRLVEKITGSHQFRIMGYSIDKGKGIGYDITSATFKVSGYDWDIKFFPNGATKEAEGFVSLYLRLLSKVTDVKTQYNLTMLDKHGRNPLLSHPSKFWTFDGTKRNCLGFSRLIKKTKLESYLSDDDCFVIKCTLTVLKVSKFGVMDPSPFVVPPSEMQQQFARFLESGNGVDVTFEVDGQTFKARRSILAARSPVFNAQFYGPLKEVSDTIKIEGIEAPVFAALLDFVYSDSSIEMCEFMAEHLLVVRRTIIAGDSAYPPATKTVPSFYSPASLSSSFPPSGDLNLGPVRSGRGAICL